MEEKTVFFLYKRFTDVFEDEFFEFITFEKHNRKDRLIVTEDYKEAHYFGEGLIELSDDDTLDYILDFRILADFYLDNNVSAVIKAFDTFEALGLDSNLIHLGIAKRVNGSICEDSILQALNQNHIMLFTHQRDDMVSEFENKVANFFYV